MKRSSLSRSTRRNAAVALCAAGLVAGLLAAPTASASPGSDTDLGEVLKTFDAVSVKGLVGFDTRTGKTLDLEPLKAITNVVDAVTGQVLGKSSLKVRASAQGSGDGLRSCIKSKNRRGLTMYNPIDRYLAFDKGSVQFQYHAYRLKNARDLEGGVSTQWEMCSTGGGDLDGDRLRRVGTGMAFDDAGTTRRIGHAWQTGTTPENYTLGLGFQVEKGPVSIGASLTQQPSDKLLGSFRGPYDSYMNGLERNAVNAWWQDNCIGRWYGCLPNSGSHDFQGAIAHGLWEFPKDEEPPVVYFHITPYVSS